MLNFFSKFIDTNSKEITRLQKIVDEINSLETSIKKLKDQDFVKKTQEFKKHLAENKKFEDILPQAFALVREASWRAIGLRQHDVQLMAGVVLFEGKVAEQKTGEGKTLSAVAPLYLRSLAGKNVHLVTVNDYLARRDAGWNGPIYNLLGLSVGAIIQEGKSFVFDREYNDSSFGDERLAHLRPVLRSRAYECDITVGTNNEFGFDYLRDNGVSSLEEMVQKGHYFSIVDEVDSVLIDEARTPLIISTAAGEPTEKYYKFANLVGKLSSETDYSIDEKFKTANLTEHGIAKVEKILGVSNLYEKEFETIHHIENALRAKTLYLRDKDYVVRENQVVIVDEFTGRLMFGRRWSDGLHQAVEAKENVVIQQETRTLATISFQNYFRMYEHLSGMTGTAATESEEFHKIYDLDVVVIPTYKPNQRKDFSDVIYKSVAAKYTAVAEEVDKERRAGRPILVGTTSIEKNEIISDYLKRKKIPHQVLNAKNHEKEALIIARAGEPGAVTVATNMAGRGVDIILGGERPDAPPGVDRETHQSSKEYQTWLAKHDRIIASGGLCVLGTERHESRRIDNQLRGRSGRLGDPGSSRFFLSLEDDLMRIFGGDKIAGLMERLNIPQDQPIENKLISKAIEQAQVKVEGFHFDSRKRVVEYDDVANQQREIVYKLRKNVLESESLKDKITERLTNEITNIVSLVFAEADGAKPNYERLLIMFLEIAPYDDVSQKRILSELQTHTSQEALVSFLTSLVFNIYEQREKQVGEKIMRDIEKLAYRSSIDSLWIEHLDNIDDLREGVGLRGYGQKDPLVEFKNEAFELFDKLMADIDATLARRIFRILPTSITPAVDVQSAQTNEDLSDHEGLVQTNELQTKKLKNQGTKKLGRNDPCWCGKVDFNGKPIKWKRCHYPQLPQN